MKSLSWLHRTPRLEDQRAFEHQVFWIDFLKSLIAPTPLSEVFPLYLKDWPWLYEDRTQSQTAPPLEALLGAYEPDELIKDFDSISETIESLCFKTLQSAGDNPTFFNKDHVMNLSWFAGKRFADQKWPRIRIESLASVSEALHTLPTFRYSELFVERETENESQVFWIFRPDVQARGHRREEIEFFTQVHEALLRGFIHRLFFPNLVQSAIRPLEKTLVLSLNTRPLYRR